MARPALDTDAGKLWLFVTQAQATRHREATRLDDAERSHLQILRMLQQLPDPQEQQAQIATTWDHLGIIAQYRGQLEEAEDWYRKSLALREDLGDQRRIAASYHQLGMLIKARAGGRKRKTGTANH